jgi:hypothetical protein
MKWYHYVIVTLVLIVAVFSAVFVTILVTDQDVTTVTATVTTEASETKPAAQTPDVNILGERGSGFIEGAYMGNPGERHIFSFSQEKKDSQLGIIILPNYNKGRCITVDDTGGVMPDFIYHNGVNPEGYTPIVHPTMKDASGRHIVVFQKTSVSQPPKGGKD